MVDGSPFATSITHYTVLKINIKNHTEIQPFFVTNLGNVQAILAAQWLHKHNPETNWRSLSLVFNSPSCFSCCQSSPTSVKAPQIVEGLPETPASIPPVIPTPPFTVNTTAKVQPHPSKPSVKVTATANTTAEVNLAPTISSSLISGSSFARKLRQNNKFGWLPYTPYPILVASLQSQARPVSQPLSSGISQLSLSTPEPDPPQYIQEIKKMIPLVYHEFLPAFSKTLADELPPYTNHDHSIELKPGTTAPFGRSKSQWL